MKNQLDLIFSICAFVVATALALTFFYTARKPEPPPAVTVVNLTPVALPASDVSMANGIPSAGATRGGRGGGPGGGAPGGVGIPPAVAAMLAARSSGNPSAGLGK